MQGTKKKDLATRLAIALDMRQKAKIHTRPEENPLAQHSLDEVVQGAGIGKSADRIPAVNVAATPVKGLAQGAALALEASRFETNKAGRDAKAARRQAAARARAKRKLEVDALVNSDVRPNPKRLKEAWEVVVLLAPIVEAVAASKSRWAARYLGSLVEDVSQVVLERMAMILAKSDYDLDLLHTAAKELRKSKRKIPGDQVVDEEAKAERKRLAKARKWLMGMINNRVMGTLVDLYLGDQNLRWQNIDIVATVMASISGVGEDPLTSRFKADRAPAMLGTKFQRPGGVDYDVLTAAVQAAITEHGLDDLTDLLLADESLRSNGSVRWHAIAEQVFMTGPGNGEHRWHLVQQATASLSEKTRKQLISKAAMTYARNQFRWLPEVIVGVVQAHDVHVVGYGVRPVLASTFEWDYLSCHRYDVDPMGEHRSPLRPALTYASTAEAAEALDEVLDLIGARELVLTGMEA